MTHAAVRPPRLAERLLATVLGGDEWSESILGDLHEEHAVRAARSRPRAAAWYWTHAVRLSTRGMAARTRAALSSPSLLAPPVTPPHPGDSLMRTLGLEVRHACRSILQAPGDERHRRHHPGTGARRQRGGVLDDRCAGAPAVHDAGRRSHHAPLLHQTGRHRSARSPLASRLPRHEAAAAGCLRAARRLRLVECEPGRTGRTRERAGLLRLGRLLPGVGRAAGDGSNLPSRRGDAGPAPAGRSSVTVCGSGGSRPTRRSSAGPSKWTRRSTRSSASRRRASTSRWVRRSGRRCRSTPRRPATAAPSI